MSRQQQDDDFGRFAHFTIEDLAVLVGEMGPEYVVKDLKQHFPETFRLLAREFTKTETKEEPCSLLRTQKPLSGDSPLSSQETKSDSESF